MEVRGVDQTPYPSQLHGASLAAAMQRPCRPLQERKKKRRGFASIQMLHTHTPGRNRVDHERQEEEKSGHKRRAKVKTAQGGKGTNGPPEPTYTARRT